MARLDQITGALHDGQCGETEKIHFKQSERLDDGHLKLGDGLDGRLFRAAGRAVQRDVLKDRLVGDDHPGGVGASIAHRAFHMRGGVDQFLQVRRLIIDIL